MKDADNTKRKSTTIYIRDDLLAEAGLYKIDLSRAVEEGFIEAIEKARKEQAKAD